MPAKRIPSEAILANIKHGHSKKGFMSITYKSWVNMTSRCEKPNHQSYPNYGGRGIKICEGLRAFSWFLFILGTRPEGFELDRWPDNKNGHYSCGQCQDCVTRGWPLNVRWATREQNCRNTRKNLVLTVRGKTGCLAELSEFFKVDKALVSNRLCRGYSLDDAFFAEKYSKYSKYSTR